MNKTTEQCSVLQQQSDSQQWPPVPLWVSLLLSIRGFQRRLGSMQWGHSENSTNQKARFT